MTRRTLRIRVRRARRSDIPAVVRSATSSTNEREGVGFGAPWSERTFTDPRRLSSVWTDPNRAGSEEVYVAERAGELLGYVTTENRGREIELVRIDVPRELQRQGIGTALVRSVEQRARRAGRTAVTLGTSRSASGVAWKSLPWWLSLDYRITGEVENDWTRSIAPGTREIRLRKDLTRSVRSRSRPKRRGGMPSTGVDRRNVGRTTTRSDPREVEEYLDGVPAEFQPLLQDLRRTIRSAAPEATEVLSYRMPAFRQQGVIVYYAAFQDHCSIFLPSAGLRRVFARELRPFLSGKATLRVTPDRPIPPRLVRRLVKARLAEIERRNRGRRTRPGSATRRP